MSPEEERNVRLFDRLAFEAWNRDDWKLFAELHTDDVTAEAGGERTTGIGPHIEQSKRFLASAPGGRVAAHPVSFGSGPWTCTIAELTSGRKMAIICRWRDGRIAEEYVFP
jgi:hypothetical protein